MSEKTDKEEVLRFFYDRRNDGVKKLGEHSAPEGMSPAVFFRICGNLGEDGFIKWTPIRDGMYIKWGTGEITSQGIKAHENRVNLMASTNTQHVVVNNSNSPGANFHFGNGNIHQEVAWLNFVSQEIDKTNASPEEKKEAKSLLGKISENKLVNTIFGSAIGELIKATLPK